MNMKRILLGVVTLSMLTTACGSDEAKQSDESAGGNDSTAIEINDNGEPIEPAKLLSFDTLLTDRARLISGMEPIGNDSVLHAIYNSDLYASHKEFTQSTWESTLETMVEPIHAWTEEKQIGDTRKGTLCFYPLSGPDFLFGNTFFPNAGTYVMLGLERRGSMPSFADMDNRDQEVYFNGIRGSLKYLNSRGYFVTSHMGSDFSKRHLNGMLHMILYMMTRTGHYIQQVDEIYIGKDGKPVHLEEGEKAPEGSLVAIHVHFITPDRKEVKELFYFGMNAADDHLADNPEFVEFVESYENRVAYMKSASCVLFNPGFETMRKLVIESDKVLQDDTGMPYRYFVADSSSTIELYGTYTRVISDLSWCIQPDLKKDLVEKGENTKLPFKISYNGHKDEGVLIYVLKEGVDRY